MTWGCSRVKTTVPIPIKPRLRLHNRNEIRGTPHKLILLPSSNRCKSPFLLRYQHWPFRLINRSELARRLSLTARPTTSHIVVSHFRGWQLCCLLHCFESLYFSLHLLESASGFVHGDEFTHDELVFDFLLASPLLVAGLWVLEFVEDQGLEWLTLLDLCEKTCFKVSLHCLEFLNETHLNLFDLC